MSNTRRRIAPAKRSDPFGSAPARAIPLVAPDRLAGAVRFRPWLLCSQWLAERLDAPAVLSSSGAVGGFDKEEPENGPFWTGGVRSGWNEISGSDGPGSGVHLLRQETKRKFWREGVDQ